MALINRTSNTWPARCLKLTHMSLPSLSFPLFPSIFFPSFFSAFNTLFFLHPKPFIHLAFILVISVFEFDWLKSQLEVERLESCICGRILRPIFTASFFKVNCSFQWCFSMCERSVFSTDYLPMNMIKVTEHLCMFTSAAYMSVLVCFCVLLLERHVYAYVLQNVTIPHYVCNHFYNHYTLCPTCVWHSLIIKHKTSLWK